LPGDEIAGGLPDDFERRAFADGVQGVPVEEGIDLPAGGGGGGSEAAAGIGIERGGAEGEFGEVGQAIVVRVGGFQGGGTGEAGESGQPAGPGVQGGLVVRLRVARPVGSAASRRVMRMSQVWPAVVGKRTALAVVPGRLEKLSFSAIRLVVSGGSVPKTVRTVSNSLLRVSSQTEPEAGAVHFHQRLARGVSRVKP